MNSVEITAKEIDDAILINNQASMLLLQSKGVPIIGLDGNLKFDSRYEYSSENINDIITYSWVLKDAN
jgi:hypothetical protein